MKLPITIVMITYNEAHYIFNAISNHLKYVSNVIIIDSYSTDQTVELATKAGAVVYQRKFKSFGDQWNFAATKIPVQTSWVMKMDPDEMVNEDFWYDLNKNLENNYNGISVVRRLWFMNKPLTVRHELLRLWKSDKCYFEKVSVNEHPIVEGPILDLKIEIQHHDSPHLHHWIDKQNSYTTLDARARLNSEPMAFEPSFFGNSNERRMYFKKYYHKIPFRHHIYYMYCLFVLGAIRSGKIGIKWSKLRKFVFQMREEKYNEIKKYGDNYPVDQKPLGNPSPLAIQCRE